MHILITNDDGIQSIGLKALADAALKRGHRVTISAPSSQCSANSQHITLTAPLLVHPTPWEGAKAYAVDGTPTDAVRVAPFMTEDPLDFYISGINRGENAGSAVYYSGTVGAAREAAMCYIPSMAVSIMPGADDDMRRNLADIAVRVAEHFQGVALPRFTLINLNAPAIPPAELKPLKVCPLSRAYYLDGYEKRVSPLGQMYFWLKANDTSGVPMEPCEEGSDYDYLRKGHVTCTFLGDFTDYNGSFAARIADLTQ
ncbi:MAG: 5'/3'-nucleotidase SurE [Clostridia bacterium]|nr:5'/3'-nucleotidase SurE [Clostridia bacterium]